MEHITCRRNFIAFWLFGLFNNFIYVIMLSSAVDILEKENTNNSTNETGNQTRANCTEIGSGFLPLFYSLKLFSLKVSLSLVLALAALIIVALSGSVALSLFGVVCASLSCGLGDITFLTMVTFFENNSILAWSSGTGAAGIASSLFYAAMTSFLSPQTTLLATMFAPFALLITYLFVLKKPDSPMFHVNWHPSTCCPQGTRYTPLPPHEPPANTAPPPSSYLPDTTGVAAPPVEVVNDETDEFESISPPPPLPVRQHFQSQSPAEIDEEVRLVNPTNPAMAAAPETTLQITPNWATKKRIFKLLGPLMFYLSSVYFFEYLINQSLFELIYFNNTSLDHAQQYRWFQALYQCGVFLSRSSLKLFRVRRTWVLAILQALNFAVFLIQVIYPFAPHIWIVFVLIVYEGVLGGLSYVNTFNRVLTEIEGAHREYSMSVAAFSDALGITVAALLSIPLHNWLCRLISP